MPLRVSQILAGTTEQQALDAFLDDCRSMGFNTTSWQDGSTQHTILRALARSYAGASNTLADVLYRLLVQPSGAWQELRGALWYQCPIQEATPTQRAIKFTSALSAPPHVILKGSIVTTAAGVRYETTANNTALAAGANVTLAARALAAGVAGNVAVTTALSLVTPYAGVTATFSGDPTYAGTAKESATRYQFRLDRWFADLTYSVGVRAYEKWALVADPSIERVVAYSASPAPGDVRIVLAPGTVSQIANVSAYIASRHPPHDYPTVEAAVVVNQAIISAPRIKVGTTTVAVLEAAWQAYLDAMPIGGVRVAGAPAGRLLPEALTRTALCTLTGVESVSLTTPAAAVVLAPNEVVTGVFTTTPEFVA